MPFQSFPALEAFLSSTLADGDPENDATTIQGYLQNASEDSVEKTVTQLKAFLDSKAEISLEDLGTTANRWFAEPSEAQAWLSEVLTSLSGSKSGQSSSNSTSAVVKDSNGTVLLEGDSVTVIKDLKVKGAASDLKRGTIVKKIHLVDDPEVIEARVNGSTLVLKTCFLKKA
jgi:protein PhnA